MLTPEAQLMAAYQAAQQQPMMPQIPLTYNTADEEAGMGITSASIATGASAANFATMAPGFMLPMMLGMPLISKLGSSALGRSAAGGIVRGAFSPINALLNPIGAFSATKARAAALGLGTFGSGAMGVAAALPSVALALGAGSAISYASKNVFQGAQDYVATRQLMREMPGVGFGATSVLGGGSGLTDLSAGQISQANQSIQSIGGRHGLDASASRNLLSNLSQTGMIDTSSVKAMSQSYQKALSDFKLMAKTLQIDIDQTIELYKGLDQLGLRGNSERRAVLARAASTSSLTGKSLDSVMQTVAGAISTGNSLGLSSYASSNVATRAMAVSALAERAGAVPESYLNRVGGYDGYTNRMIELELGMSRSSGAMRMMSNMYDTSGRFRSDNQLSAGERGRSGGSFFRNVDPYELDRMSQEMSGALPSLVLARVDAIQSRHGAGTVRANREQHRFLQTMGIEDPQEQLAFLMSARSAGAGQFAQGMQASTDRLNAAPAAAAEAMQRETLGLKDALRLMTSTLTTELRSFGEAMQAASEEAAGRISVSRGGIRFSPTNFQASTQQLGIVSDYIRQGKIDPFTADPMNEVMGLEGRYRDSISRGLSSSIAFTGITRAEGRGMLTGRHDQTIARFGYDLPEQIENIAGSVRRAALGTVFGEDVFNPDQSSGDILGGFSTGGDNPAGAYTVRRGNNENRGRATFGQIMENVAQMHGQYYDSRTNTILRTNAFGERQFRNQYGDSLDEAMNQFRGDVSSSIRSQVNNTLIREGTGLTGAVIGGAAIGFGSGFVFGGGVGSIPGMIVGGALGGLAYTGIGGMSGSVRAARENLFGDTGGGPRMLSGDVQQDINTNRGAAATRNYLANQVFGKRYDELSQSQRMYFDNYLRTNPEAADFAGVVSSETESLSRYEIASLGIDIVQEGLTRNVFTTERDSEVAESRRNIFREAINVTSEQKDRSTAALREISRASQEFYDYLDSSRQGRVTTVQQRMEAGGRRSRIQREQMELLTDEDRLLLDNTNLTSQSGRDSLVEQIDEREAAARAATQSARESMTEAQRTAFDAASPEEKRAMLRELAATETRDLQNRIQIGSIEELSNNGIAGATVGALNAIRRAGGENNSQALQFALARTTAGGARLSDMTLNTMFSSGGTRADLTNEVNQNSRDAAVLLLARQQSQGTNKSEEEIITEQLIQDGVPAREAGNRARQIVLQGTVSVESLSPETQDQINNALSGGPGFSLPDGALLSTTLSGIEDTVTVNAVNQYAAAFDEVSSQNMNVLRERRAGGFLQSNVARRMGDIVGTGADAFANLKAGQIAIMQDELGQVRGQIRSAEGNPNTDPAELERLRREAIQLEEYINLSGSSESEAERMANLATNALFDAEGNFMSGAVGAVLAEHGFAGATGSVNSIAALVSGGSARQQTAALEALIGDGDTADFAARLGLGADATLEDIRAEVNRTVESGDTSWLMDLVGDVVKSTDVEVSDAARESLQDRGFQAMIEIAETRTHTDRGVALRIAQSGGLFGTNEVQVPE